jgi:DNA-directed RNA polymerase subunit H (RpoH/RPB5)
MTSTTRITQIYKSRCNLIKLLVAQGYDMTDKTNFSINEVNTMYWMSKMDIRAMRESDGCKVYVKYHSAPVSKNIRSAIDNIVDDLYVNEKTLTPRDTLIIVVDDEPNDSIIAKMKHYYDTAGIFIVMHYIKRLQFNILEHVLVPRMEVLSVEECAEFMRERQISDKSKLPSISRFDPHALALCVRPGQVCRIHRSSETAIETLYYRVCV